MYLSCSRMPEPAGAAFGPGKGVHRDKLRFLDPGENQLRYPVATIDRKRLSAEIEQDYPDLATIVGIDRSRCVQHANAVFECEPAPWPYLSLVSLGDGDGDPRGDELPLSSIENNLTFHCSIEINARGVFGLIMRDGKTFGVFELRKMNNKMIGHILNKYAGTGIQEPEEIVTKAKFS